MEPVLRQIDVEAVPALVVGGGAQKRRRPEGLPLKSTAPIRHEASLLDEPRRSTTPRACWRPCSWCRGKNLALLLERLFREVPCIPPACFLDPAWRTPNWYGDLRSISRSSLDANSYCGRIYMQLARIVVRAGYQVHFKSEPLMLADGDGSPWIGLGLGARARRAAVRSEGAGRETGSGYVREGLGRQGSRMASHPAPDCLRRLAMEAPPFASIGGRARPMRRAGADGRERPSAMALLWSRSNCMFHVKRNARLCMRA
jgi:hypothetical protein